MPKPKTPPLPFSRAAFRAAYVEELRNAPFLGCDTAERRAAKMLGDLDPGRPFPLYLRSNPCAMRAAKRFGFTTDRDFRAAWAAATPEDLPQAPARPACGRRDDGSTYCRCGAVSVWANDGVFRCVSGSGATWTPAPEPIEVPCPTCAEPMTPGGWHED